VTPSRTIFPTGDFQSHNLQVQVPATQSVLIVAIIGRLVTPEPGIFPALDAFRGWTGKHCGSRFAGPAEIP
jgi:hypothetical protein